MTVEVINGQVIANNYGHGGCGWTLGPGAANYVNNLLLNSEHASDLQQDTPITIIGVGALGLYTAYDLHQKGYTNLTIVADKFQSFASDNAGGLFAPACMNNTMAIQNVIDQVAIYSYKFYAGISHSQNPDFKHGAVIMPVYLQDKDQFGLGAYVGKIIQPPKDVIIDFGNGTTRQMIVYDDGIFIDTAQMIKNLTVYLRSKNVAFEHKKVKSFNEIKSQYIMNCSGLGAVDLNSDTQMVPVQGHLIMLKDQNPTEMQYMITVRLNDTTTKNGQKNTRAFYLFPKHSLQSDINDVGVLGGTFIEGATKETPNEEEFEIMIHNAKVFYGLVS